MSICGPVEGSDAAVACKAGDSRDDITARTGQERDVLIRFREYRRQSLAITGDGDIDVSGCVGRDVTKLPVRIRNGADVGIRREVFGLGGMSHVNRAAVRGPGNTEDVFVLELDEGLHFGRSKIEHSDFAEIFGVEGCGK